MNIDVFISYHASDLHIVEKIVSKLENKGLNCWYASRDISNNYAESITTAIKSCRVFVLVLNKVASESLHVLNELNLVTERLSAGDEVDIIPFRTADTEISEEAKYYIGRMHWLDAMIPPLEDRLDELAKHIVTCILSKSEASCIEKKEKPSVPYEGSEKYVFISYAHKDNEIVFPIITRLQNESFRIWYDDGIEPGNEWDESIAEHIQNATIMLAFISNNYIESDNCKDELKFARDENIDRILIYLEDTELPAGIRMRLGGQQAIHYFRYIKKEDFYDKLANILGLKNLKKHNNISEIAMLSSIINKNEKQIYLLRKKTDEIIELKNGMFYIGTSEKDCRYLIKNNDRISKIHAGINVTNSIVTLVDLRSTNHSYINGVMIEPKTSVLLKINDVVRLADEDFIVLSGEK